MAVNLGDLVAGQNLGDIAQSVMVPSDVLMGFKRAGDLPALLGQQGLGAGPGRDTLGARLAFAHKQAQGKWLVNHLPLSKRQQPLTQIHPALRFAPADRRVIPPFLTGCSSRTYAAIFSFWAGVMPPMPIFGRPTAR